jgi:hypothetical protein
MGCDRCKKVDFCLYLARLEVDILNILEKHSPNLRPLQRPKRREIMEKAAQVILEHCLYLEDVTHPEINNIEQGNRTTTNL